MYEDNIVNLKKIFTPLTSKDKVYETLMKLGRENSGFNERRKTTDTLVSGCQSTMYLDAVFTEGRLYFSAWSDALISSGLAQVLILAYNGLQPEVVLKSEPTFLNELGIPGSLTPGRANGLYQIHLKMKQHALRFMMQQQS